MVLGVFLRHTGTPTFEERCAAALAYAGQDSMVTGLAACRLHGLRRMPPFSDVHVLVPAEHQPVTRGYITVERTTRPPLAAVRHDLRVAPVVRCSLDGVRRLGSVDQIRALLAEVVQSGRATPTQLITELNSGCSWGSALPRRVLGEVSGGIRSTAEAWAHRLARRSKLPAMLWNPELRLPSGRFLARPDGWFDDVALAWEIDSYEFHLSPADYARTLERHALMTAAGVVVLHTLPTRLLEEPRAVVAELRGAYALAQSRPRPDLIVLPA